MAEKKKNQTTSKAKSQSEVSKSTGLKQVNKAIPKRLQGTVVSTKMQDTIVVRVEIKFAHPLYKKIIKSHKKYLVHCENEEVKVGDIVAMEEGKPVSRGKTFYFLNKIEK